MEHAAEKRLVESVGDWICSKRFECYQSGFTILCKAQDIGIESYLVCLEEDPQECPLSLPFGSLHFCKSPLRVYIAKKLKD